MKQYSKKTIRSVLREGVDIRRHYPLCDQFDATHAASNAVVGVSVRAMKEELIDIIDQVDVFCGEVDREHVFTPEKLQEHVGIAAIVKAAIHQVAGHGDRQLIVNKVLSQLRQGDVGACRAAIGQAVTAIDWIAAHMGEALARTKMNQTVDFKALLKNDVAVKLVSIKESLEKAVSELGNIAVDADNLWKASVKSLRRIKKCKKGNV